MYAPPLNQAATSGCHARLGQMKQSNSSMAWRGSRSADMLFVTFYSVNFQKSSRNGYGKHEHKDSYQGQHFHGHPGVILICNVLLHAVAMICLGPMPLSSLG